MRGKYEELKELIITGQKDKIKGVVTILLDSGNSPTEILSEGLISGMSVVGGKFREGELFIPEVLASAHAMNEGMELLKPKLIGDKSTSYYIGKIVIGTVQGDVHNIGKNLVGMLMECEGFRIVDLGVDVPAEKFIEAIKNEHPNLLGLSSLLTSTMPRMKDVIEALKRAGIRDKVRVMIGGAPVTQDFANSIGADGFAPDGSSAVAIAKKLL